MCGGEREGFLWPFWKCKAGTERPESTHTIKSIQRMFSCSLWSQLLTLVLASHMEAITRGDSSLQALASRAALRRARPRHLPCGPSLAPCHRGRLGRGQELSPDFLSLSPALKQAPQHAPTGAGGGKGEQATARRQKSDISSYQRAEHLP